MTANQIRKVLESAGINMGTILEIGRDTVEIFVREGEEGYADHGATEAAHDAVRAALPWGGYKTGYGSWILEKGFTVSEYFGMGTADPSHY